MHPIQRNEAPSPLPLPHNDNVFLIMKALHNDFLMRVENKLKNEHINRHYYLVFFYLNAGVSQLSELAALANVTQQAIGKKIKFLERQGFLVREKNNRDGRAKVIILSDKGREFLKNLLLSLNWVMKDYERRLGRGPINQLDKVVKNVTREVL